MNINVVRLACQHVEDDYFNNLNACLNEYAVCLKENVINSPVNIVLIETGGVESKFKNEVLNTLEEPIFIVATNRANSLAASLEIVSYLKQRDIEHRLFVNNDTFNLAEEIVNAILIKTSAKSIKGTRLGVIGKPSDWLIASEVDYFKVKKKFGIQLVDISLQELMDIYERKDLPIVRPKNLKEIHDKCKGKLEGLPEAVRLYSALKVLVDIYHLDGLTVRCFDVVNIKKVTACLALALLNDEGTTCACEGDIPSMLTMFMIKKLLNQETFMVNPSKIDKQNDTIMFAHCTIPLNLCTTYDFDTHYETGESIGVKGELQEKIINISKISPDLEKFNCVIARINRNLSLPGHCRTQVEVSLHDKTIDEFLSMRMANHVVLSYDNHKKLFEDFFNEFK